MLEEDYTHSERVSRVEARMDNIENQLARLITGLDKLTAAVHRPQTVQWGWILAAVFGITTLAGGYTNIVTGPITKRQTENSADIDYIEAALVSLNSRVGAIEARQEAGEARDVLMRQTLRDVDLYGPRGTREETTR